jgi:outer membrane protein assembly factor BamB
MRRVAILISAWLAIFAALPQAGRGQARDLYPNTPDEVIQKRASQQGKPLWQIPLGPALIENMQAAGPDRLLVSLRKDFPGLPNLDTLLVDTSNGEVLWRYSRDRLKGQYDCLLILQDLLLFRVDRGKTASLLALDAASGQEKWTASFKGEKVMFVPFMAGGSALAINPGPDSVELTALALDGGQPLWQKSFRTVNGAEQPAPISVGEDLLVFYNGLERLSSKDGKTVFTRADLVFDGSCPPPQVEDDVIWAVHSGRRMSALDAASGQGKWTVDLPGDVSLTNIYPLNGKLYVRGVDASGAHKLHALSRADGRLLWFYSGAEPNISNLIESGGVLYFGTPTSLIALDAGSGGPVFSVVVTTTGRAFPIRIRETGGRIVYIGELVAAAFDAKTGRLVYKQGMSPGSGELHLNGLDDAVPNLKEELGKSSKNPAGDQLRGQASFASAEAARYQNLSLTYRSQASYSWDRGDMLGSSVATMKQSFARHEARLQSMTAFVMNVVNIGLMIRQLLSMRSIKTAIERQEMFRKSILASYAQAETADYVYRPHLLFRDAADVFSALSIVHLPTGKRSETILSPHYLSYGLWQIVDFEKGVVYHSNIGMDPSRYELSEARAYYPYKKAKTVNTFLIAQPVKVPR